MRLIHVNKIKEGDIIARDIVGYEGGLLLKCSSKFKNAFREKLIERNIYEIYIEDELSRGIFPEPLISSKVRLQIDTDIKEEFDKLRDTLHIDVKSIGKVTETLIEELSKNQIICDVMDLKINDGYTYQHCIGVAILSAIICRKMKMSEDHTYKIVMGALMHDIGKMIIPKDILNKPTKLSQEEYDIIKGHPELGYKMIEKNSLLSPITKLTVLCHHEREDGSGYPLGKGEELHIGAKIVGACDLFHALLSNRPYRQALSVKEVTDIANKEKINGSIREIIESVLAFYPVGSVVLLSNGDVGIVAKNFPQNVERPLVRIIYNMHNYTKQTYQINLQEEQDLQIIQKLQDVPF